MSRCPLCGQSYCGYGAVSRRDNRTEICPDCGVDEAKRAFLARRDALGFHRGVEMRSRNGDVIGTATIRRGRVTLTGVLSQFEGRVLFDWDLSQITQDAGRPWLDALLREFRNPYVHIFPLDAPERTASDRFVWRDGDIKWVAPPEDSG